MISRIFLLLLILFNPTLNPLFADSKDKTNKQITSEDFSPERFVDSARAYLNRNKHPTTYQWGGRDTKNHPGLDCLGLIFVSIQSLIGIKWTHWSVIPSKLIEQLGGERGILLLMSHNMPKDLAIQSLKMGDLIFFLSTEKIRDIPLVVKRVNKTETEYRVIHTAIYTGDGKIIHASPFDDNICVVEEDLFEFIERNQLDGYIAIEPCINTKGMKRE